MRLTVRMASSQMLCHADWGSVLARSDRLLLDELDHYVFDFEEEIFRRKSVYVNICEESRNILSLEILQICHRLLTRIGVDHEKMQRGRPRSGRYSTTRHLCHRLGTRWIWRHYRFQQIFDKRPHTIESMGWSYCPDATALRNANHKAPESNALGTSLDQRLQGFRLP